ncbi:MAG: thioredoxin-disulfide reductase [Planctomycetota bacterium]|nr:thioredoxin-disulfide reductase [Planctomycetota bacterium]
MLEETKVLIIGGGPAGLTAGIYAARAKLDPILIAGPLPGGQLTGTSDIENFPGFPEPQEGMRLMENMQRQAERVGTKIILDEVKSLDLRRRPFSATVSSGDEYHARTIIFATGARPRMLGLPEEKEFLGRGLSTCAVCDGAFYRGKEVAVVGGGDSAMEEAGYLAKMCRKVTVIHRRSEFRASKIMVERVRAMPNVTWELDSVVTAIISDPARKGVAGVAVRNVGTGGEKQIPVAGVFLAIGHIPETGLVKGQVELDEEGYIAVNERQETNVPGFFAAGDCHDRRWRQAVTAAAFGCRAALEAERYLTREGIA